MWIVNFFNVQTQKMLWVYFIYRPVHLQVRLTLPWKHQTFLHYTVVSVWPPGATPEWDKCRVEV